MISHKGQTKELAAIILIVIVLVIVLAIIFTFSEKGAGLLESVKNLFSFG